MEIRQVNQITESQYLIWQELKQLSTNAAPIRFYRNQLVESSNRNEETYLLMSQVKVIGLKNVVLPNRDIYEVVIKYQNPKDQSQTR